MSTVTITFNIPDEQEELYSAQHGVDYAIILSDFDNWLRSKIKYEELSDHDLAIYQSVRDELHQITADRDVHF